MSERDQWHPEARAVAERYARRAVDGRYDPLRPEVWLARQERQRALIALLGRHVHRPLESLEVLEIGTGYGDKLLELVQLGFDPARLVANELLPERAAVARQRLPAAIALHEGDASMLTLPDTHFDIVLQSTVFTSLLDDGFQRHLADRMWRWLRPGGAVLWYDFVRDNPRNRDVRGVPLARIRALFPLATIDARRVTLAPPLARAVVRVHPLVWRLCNALPALRSHLLAWIEKPR
jgi:SAM-dependent methyltransferase